MKNLILFIKNISLNENHLVKNNINFYIKKNNNQNIYKNLKNWKNSYYKYFYKTNCRIYIKKIMDNYLEMFYWTFKYYFNNTCDDWKIFYKYEAAFSITDLFYYIKNNYNINNIVLQKNKALNTDQLICCIFPLNLLKKLNNKYVNIIESNSDLYYMYPINFKYETMDKLFEWMHEPILPLVNLNLIEKYIK